MALKITKIIDQVNRGQLRVGLEFKLDKKEDAFMAQAILRALADAHGAGVSFGYNDKMEHILEFDYGCGKIVNRLLYDGLGQIALEKITPGSTTAKVK